MNDIKSDIKPFCLYGNIYFVGSTKVSVHIIKTEEGLVMIDTGYPDMYEQIKCSMEEVGLNPADIVAIFHSHGHIDHFGCTKQFKELSGAKTYISRIDNNIVNGMYDLSWAYELGMDRLEYFSCDVLVDDGDCFTFGDTKIRCVLTPGHTAGVLSFFIETSGIVAAMHGGIGTNSMTTAFLDRYSLSYECRDHFREGLKKLADEKVDLVLGNHPQQSGTSRKLELVERGESALDPEQWKVFLENAGKSLDDVLAKEETERTLFSTLPDTEGKKAVIRRARQLTEFHWTALGEIPTFMTNTGKTAFVRGERYKGVIYSSTEATDKFICENISLESFASAIKNPDSVIYTKDIGGHGNSWAYFGVVCNGLVRYALNIRRRFSTAKWLNVPGMKLVFNSGAYSADDLQLCDVLWAYGVGANHVALVTDLLRDKDGAVQKIEISEATRPRCMRRVFTVDEYFEKYKVYSICRYDYVDSVPMPEDGSDEIMLGDAVSVGAVAVDMGNKSNYRTSEEVGISVFPHEDNEIEIYRDGNPVSRLTLPGRCKISKRFERGYYTVKHVKTGDEVEFCVYEPDISLDVKDGVVTVKADSCDKNSAISHMDFRVKDGGLTYENPPQKYYNRVAMSLNTMVELTDEEKKTGIITRKIPEGAGSIKVTFENKYGMWTHPRIDLI